MTYRLLYRLNGEIRLSGPLRLNDWPTVQELVRAAALICFNQTKVAHTRAGLAEPSMPVPDALFRDGQEAPIWEA